MHGLHEPSPCFVAACVTSAHRPYFLALRCVCVCVFMLMFCRALRMWGTDEDVLIEIIGFAGPSQAAALRYEYAMRYGHTLASAVRDETSGDLEALLLAFLDPPPSALAVADKPLAVRQAVELWEAAEGMGTRTGPFVDIFGACGHAQLVEVMGAFEQAFSRPLVEMLRHEFHFNLGVRKLCLTRCRWARQKATAASIPAAPAAFAPAEAAAASASLLSFAPSAPGQLLLVRIESDDPTAHKRLQEAVASASPEGPQNLFGDAKADAKAAAVARLIDTSVPLPQLLVPPVALPPPARDEVAGPSARATAATTPRAAAHASASRTATPRGGQPLTPRAQPLSQVQLEGTRSPPTSTKEHSSGGQREKPHSHAQKLGSPRSSPPAAAAPAARSPLAPAVALPPPAPIAQKPAASKIPISVGSMPAPPAAAPPTPRASAETTSTPRQTPRQQQQQQQQPRKPMPRHLQQQPHAPPAAAAPPKAALPTAPQPLPSTAPKQAPRKPVPVAPHPPAPPPKPPTPPKLPSPPKPPTPAVASAPSVASPPAAASPPPAAASPSPPPPPPRTVASPSWPAAMAPPPSAAPPAATSTAPRQMQPRKPVPRPMTAGWDATPPTATAPPPAMAPPDSTPRVSAPPPPSYFPPSSQLQTPRCGSQASSALPSARSGSTTARSGIGSNPLAPPDRDTRRNKQREALQKLLVSSAAQLSKFELSVETLQRGAHDSEQRYHAFEQQLARAGNAAGGVATVLEDALTVSAHTTADMEEAAARAAQAVEAHRAAHEALAARGDSFADGSASPPLRLPAHPDEPATLAQETTTLRNAQVECRKVLRASDAAFATARSQITSVASKVQAAIAESKKTAKISVERERVRDGLFRGR